MGVGVGGGGGCNVYLRIVYYGRKMSSSVLDLVWSYSSDASYLCDFELFIFSELQFS